MTSSARDGSERPSSVVAQYETLRKSALGHQLPPEARCGLLLFLRRGMWAWAQATATASVSQRPSGSPSLSFTASDEHSVIVHVFAAIAMNAVNRGALS